MGHGAENDFARQRCDTCPFGRRRRKRNAKRFSRAESEARDGRESRTRGCCPCGILRTASMLRDQRAPMRSAVSPHESPSARSRLRAALAPRSSRAHSRRPPREDVVGTASHCVSTYRNVRAFSARMAAPPPPPTMWTPQQEGINQILQLLTEYRQPGANQQQVRRV